ncbi:MAG: GTPase [Pirellulales bacterium]
MGTPHDTIERRNEMPQAGGRTTIAVVLTPPGRGAIATVLVAGPSAVGAVESHFRAAHRHRLAEQAEGRPIFGHWGGKRGEEVVVWRAGGDRIEIHCHGGRAVVEWLVGSLEQSGCVRMGWEAWAARAEPSPIRAAARVALAEATTMRTARVLLDQYDGALDAELRRIAGLLRKARPARPAAAVARDASLSRIETLLGRAPVGLHLTRPWRVVVGGRPNVGKSSLINALVGYERAIVYHRPGTTRDVVTVDTALDGWPVRLADTAGLRRAVGAVESEGVGLSRRSLAEADLRVLVFDRSRPVTDEDMQLLAQWPDAVRVTSKCDLPDRSGPDFPTDAVPISARTGAGVAELAGVLGRRLVPEPPPRGAGVPFTPHHVEMLAECKGRLESGELQEAIVVIESLLGATPEPSRPLTAGTKSENRRQSSRNRQIG